MPKKQSPRRSSRRPMPRGKKLAAALALALVCVAGTSMLAQVNSRKKSRKASDDFGVMALPASGPSKEYVYAGSKLIAIEEGSSGSSGSGPRKVFDFEPDSKSEIAFYRNGLWGILKSSQGYAYDTPQFFSWGAAGLPPVYGDFDGDNKTDIGYMDHPSGSNQVYAILRSTTGYGFGAGQPLFVSAGVVTDKPVVGDFDGDHKADPSTWRPSTGVWTIPKSSANYSSFIFAQWGQDGDIPIVCDLDGDGKSDMGFYRSGVWGFLKSSADYSIGSPQFFSWGDTGKQPVVGDFDGDGKADIGYIEPPANNQSATYAILLSSNGYGFGTGQVLFVPAGFPSLGDTPVVGDWDADGKSDPGIWRASQGIWIIPLSSGNYGTYLFSQWGQNGDTPMPHPTTQY